MILSFKDPSRMPRRAITIGVGTIMECKRLLVLVTRPAEGGDSRQGGRGTDHLHGLGERHPDACPLAPSLCDEAAAANLKEQDYYRWIFEKRAGMGGIPIARVTAQDGKRLTTKYAKSAKYLESGIEDPIPFS